jgi:hypothetical protein
MFVDRDDRRQAKTASDGRAWQVCAAKAASATIIQLLFACLKS